MHVSSTADGRLQLFVLGGDHKIYYRSQSVPNGNWNEWALLGGDQVKDFAAGRDADGCLEIIAVWGDGALHDVWQTTPNGGWSSWASLACRRG